MKDNSNNKSLIAHLVGMSIVLFALSDVIQSRLLITAGVGLSVYSFLLFLPQKEAFKVRQSMVFIVVLLITSLVNLLFTKNGLGGTFTLIGNLLLAYLFLSVHNKNMTVWIVLAYSITVGFISYHLFILGTHPNFIYDGLSRNHAGFVVVFWTIFLLFFLKVTYNSTYILIPLFSIVLSIYLFGRTSIIVNSLLLLAVLLYKYRENNLAQVFVMSSFLVLVHYIYTTFGDILSTITNLGEGLDTPRWELWRIYFEHITVVSFFTGIDVTTLPMYEQFGGNPHNSFIKFHSRVGFGSVIYIVLYIVSVFRYVILKQFYLLSLLLLLTLRALFDGDIFIGSFDFIFIIITFYWLNIEYNEP